MKKIGIIDYFIDEWHSNTYLGLFEKASKELGVDYKVTYAYAEVEQPGKMLTDDWCAKNNVTRCYSIEELCEKSDNILILAPANPETHLKYAQIALSYGKTTYIDKTFAPDLQTAKEIFAIAEKYGTKIFTSSALRYAEEIAEYTDVKNVMIKGGGRSLEEYIIHQIEMAVKCLGVGAEKVRYSKHADQEWAEVSYPDGRYATMMFAPCMPFAATVADEEGRSAHVAINSPFFDYLIADIFHFFETGETSFCSCETLEVMKIRERVIEAKSKAGIWLNV